MIENPQCRLCELHKSANHRSVCLKGNGGDKPRLMVYLDHPNIVEDKRGRGAVSQGAELLGWMFRRMSIAKADVYIDYVLKCYPSGSKESRKHIKTKANRQQCYEACSTYRIATLQLLRPKAIVVMGAKACEAFLGSDKVGDWEGAKWIADEPFVRDFSPEVWVTYSPFYALQSPAESVEIFRVLWHAALDAGLKPKIDKAVKPYDGFGF